jgi:3'-phosphoadenosine 5'-phosphosulfate (PAPS) 3'-phosphatase
VTRSGTAIHHLAPGGPFDAFLGLPTPEKRTMAWEWDFAAADVITHEAGGRYTDVWGNRFRYNKPLPRNHGGLLASVDPATHERVLAALSPELAQLD